MESILARRLPGTRVNRKVNNIAVTCNQHLLCLEYFDSGTGGRGGVQSRRPLSHAVPWGRLILVTALIALCVTNFSAPAQQPATRNYVGFDANEYPGDALLPALRKQFAFTGYWLTNPPGADHNPWIGKRDILLRAGFGFLVVANGRLDKEILAARKSGKFPAALAQRDASAAVAAAKREGFPAHTILFLDQEEGGRMLPEQAEYLLAWTEAVARSAYRPGVYASGQPVNDEDQNGKPIKLTTIQDIREQVAAKHLHPVAFWVAQDACPPAPGCGIPAKPPSPDLSGTLHADAWQYSQSPRRPAITKACAATYNRDGNCYAPNIPQYQLDLSVSASPDPSHGR